MRPFPGAEFPLSISLASELVCIAVGLTFAYASVTKLLDMRAFIRGIRSYEIVRSPVAIAVMLVIGESAVAIGHLARIELPIAIMIGAALLTAFLVFMTSAVQHGTERSCLCFGATDSEPMDAISIARVILLLAAELWLMWNFLAGRLVLELGGGVPRYLGLVFTSALGLMFVSWCFTLSRRPRVLFGAFR